MAYSIQYQEDETEHLGLIEIGRLFVNELKTQIVRKVRRTMSQLNASKALIEQTCCDLATSVQEKLTESQVGERFAHQVRGHIHEEVEKVELPENECVSKGKSLDKVIDSLPALGEVIASYVLKGVKGFVTTVGHAMEEFLTKALKFVLSGVKKVIDAARYIVTGICDITMKGIIAPSAKLMFQ